MLKTHLDGNLNFIVNDASAYVNINYPTLGYNQDLFENDIKIIVMVQSTIYYTAETLQVGMSLKVW